MNTRQIVIGTFATSALVRLAFAVFAPGIGGDTEIYATVANNLIDNQCLSVSNIESGACVPHWGGNQPPGYPVFLATIFGMGGGLDASRVVQSILMALAVARIVYSLAAAGLVGRPLLVAAAILSLSPLDIAWGRLALTEGLSIAATTWVFAELILSIVQGRIRVIPLAVAVGVAGLLRYDNVVLLTPVLMTAFYIHGFRRGVMNLMLVGIVAAPPFAIWTVRNAAVGLNPIPPVLRSSGDEFSATGYRVWTRTWVDNLYDGARAVYPATRRQYSKIEIPEAAFGSAKERDTVLALLTELRTRDKAPIPPDIDAEFHRLAQERQQTEPISYWVNLRLKRMRHAWLTPFASAGWPEVTDDSRAGIRQMVAELRLWALAKAYPLPILERAWVAGYRYALLLISLASLVTAWRIRSTTLGRIAIILLVHAATKGLAMSMFNETRLLMTAFLSLEIAVVCSFAALILPRPPNERRLAPNL